MIFVTVGAQMPFDRLIQAVDAWAGRHGGLEILAQIGRTALRPKHIGFTERLTPVEFQRCVARASCVISHAGVGSMITALELGKPLLVMPRLARFRETRNDHQVDTARGLCRDHRIAVAMNEHELLGKLERLRELGATHKISGTASEGLISAVRALVLDKPRRAGAVGPGMPTPEHGAQDAQNSLPRWRRAA